METETRFLAGDLEIREGDGLPEISGVVMRYGSVATIGRMTERIMAGALHPDPSGLVLNFQHSRDKPLARAPDTLTLIDGPIEMRVVATTAAKDALELVRSKVIRGLSLEMQVVRETWSGTERTIINARMTGVALVDNPAYEASVLEARWRAAQVVASPDWNPWM